MSAFSLRYTRAINVYPSDDAKIPYPIETVSGTVTAVVGTGEVLVDNNVNFITLGVKIGDIVYCTTAGAEGSATVTKIVNANQLNLSNGILYTAVPADTYTIYQASDQTTIGNYGCFVYVGRTGNITVRTIGNDIITYNNVHEGDILPIQVIQVYKTGTTAGFILALW